MNWAPALAVSIGAVAGALLRWQLGVLLNSYFPVVPPGTLAANLIGGYIIGLTIAFLAQAPNVAPEWRLLIITGFCGGLTTFSTFCEMDDAGRPRAEHAFVNLRVTRCGARPCRSPHEPLR